MDQRDPCLLEWPELSLSQSSKALNPNGHSVDEVNKELLVFTNDLHLLLTFKTIYFLVLTGQDLFPH